MEEKQAAGSWNHWMTIMDEWEESGLSKKEFYKQKGIPEGTFYYWYRKLRTQPDNKGTPVVVQLEEAAEKASCEMLKIQYCGATLLVPCSSNMEAVAGVLRALCAL